MTVNNCHYNTLFWSQVELVSKRLLIENRQRVFFCSFTLPLKIEENSCFITLGKLSDNKARAKQWYPNEHIWSIWWWCNDNLFFYFTITFHMTVSEWNGKVSHISTSPHKPSNIYNAVIYSRWQNCVIKRLVGIVSYLTYLSRFIQIWNHYGDFINHICKCPNRYISSIIISYLYLHYHHYYHNKYCYCHRLPSFWCKNPHLK